MTQDRYQELIMLRRQGRVPFGYGQVIHEDGTVAPMHRRGITESEHADVLALLKLLPAHMGYDDALRYLASPEQMNRDLDVWRAKESGRIEVVPA